MTQMMSKQRDDLSTSVTWNNDFLIAPSQWNWNIANSKNKNMKIAIDATNVSFAVTMYPGGYIWHITT